MTKIIAGNWKMYKTIGESIQFLKALIPQVKNAQCKVMIAPPFTAIADCCRLAKGTNILIGGQNMSDSEEGAFTGEISARMLKEAGAKFVILGHSERRLHFGESNQLIHYKLKRAIIDELPAILCIGETEEQREKGRSEKVIQQQLDECIGGLTEEEIHQLIIAYEPVWAIGTGKTATPEMAQEMHAMIREYLGLKLPILYGGSVKPANIDSLLTQPDIDGALIGGASLDEGAFAKMVLR